MNILHLTDLHISNPAGKSEALRKGYYKEYIYALKTSLEDQDIDMIFVTGDIVDRCSFENYTHAENVLRYLANELSVSIGKLFICNGNHDVDRTTGSRKEFDAFSESLSGSKNRVFLSDFFSGYRVEDDLVLVIDSINKNYTSGLPCSEIVEDIADSIVEHISEQKVENVFILAHHATDGGQMSVFATLDEGDDWSKKHIWLAGDHIFRRIGKKPTISGKVFWFAGDVHMPQHLVIDDQRVISIIGSLNFTGGSVGGTTMAPSVRLLDTENIYCSSQFDYKRVNHTGTGCEGHWSKTSISAVSRKSDESIKVTPSNKQPKTAEPDSVIPEAIEKTRRDKVSNIQLWDKEFDLKLQETVKRKSLCQFGRFSNGAEYTSLIWLSITQLFQDYSIYGDVVKNFRDVIVDKSSCSELKKSDCLIVGIDNWGSILSARLGAATNIRSCGIGVNGGNDSYESVEVVNMQLKKITQSKKLVFLVSDVLATGSTIRKIYEDLDLDSTNMVVNLSIFADNSRSYVNLPQFDENIVLCGSVKIPIIKTNKMD